MTRSRRRTTIFLFVAAAILLAAGFGFWLLVTLQPAGFIAPNWSDTVILVLTGLGMLIGAIGALAQTIQFVIDQLGDRDNSSLRDLIYNKAPLQVVTYDTLIQTLGPSGQIPWIDRNLTTPSMFSHHDCVAILGVMKSGKSREAYELARRTFEQGIVWTIYEPTSSLDLIAEEDLAAAIQLHLDRLPAVLIIDELDLRQSEKELRRISLCMETVSACRPDTRYIVTLQHERLTSHLKCWLDSHRFHVVTIPPLSPTDRDTIIKTGAATLQAAITPSALTLLATSTTITRPWDAVRLLQAAPKLADAQAPLNDQQTVDLLNRTEDDLWAEQCNIIYKANHFARPLLDGIATFLSAGVTARVSAVHRYAVWLIEQDSESQKLQRNGRAVAPNRSDIMEGLHRAANQWATYDIVSADGRFKIPEPRLLPLYVESDVARRQIGTFIRSYRPTAAESALNLLTLPLEVYYRVPRHRVYTWPPFRWLRQQWRRLLKRLRLWRDAPAITTTSPLVNFLVERIYSWQADQALLQREMGLPAQTVFRSSAVLLQKAIAAFNSNDRVSALNLVNQAIAQNAENSVALKLRGRIYTLNGEYDQALADLEKSLELIATDEQTLAFKGHVYRLSKRFSSALADFSRAVQLDPENTYPLIGRGLCYLNMNEPESATVDLKRAVSLNPRDDDAHAHLGICRLAMSQWSAAITAFNIALQINPRNGHALVHRGIASREQGNNDQAFADFNRAIEMDPQYAPAFALRGETHRQTGNYDQALADLNRAIELDLHYRWAIVQRGMTHRSMGNYELALADLNRAIELDPKDYDAIAERCRTCHSMGNYELALADLNRAIELHPQDDGAITLRGETHRRTGNYDQAFVAFNRAIELHPKSAWAFRQRGVTHRQTGSYELALADLNRAIELDPQDDWAFRERGVTHRQTGETDLALTDLNRAIELDPTDDRYPYEMFLTQLVAGTLSVASSSLASAIAIAQESIQGTPKSVTTTLNLMVYHVASGDAQAAQRHWERATTASPGRADIDYAIRHLTDYLIVVPDNELALKMCRQLEEYRQQMLLSSAPSIVTQSPTQKDPTP